MKEIEEGIWAGEVRFEPEELDGAFAPFVRYEETRVEVYRVRELSKDVDKDLRREGINRWYEWAPIGINDFTQKPCVHRGD